MKSSSLSNFVLPSKGESSGALQHPSALSRLPWLAFVGRNMNILRRRVAFRQRPRLMIAFFFADRARKRNLIQSTELVVPFASYSAVFEAELFRIVARVGYDTNSLRIRICQSEIISMIISFH